MVYGDLSGQIVGLETGHLGACPPIFPWLLGCGLRVWLLVKAWNGGCKPDPDGESSVIAHFTMLQGGLVGLLHIRLQGHVVDV